MIHIALDLSYHGTGFAIIDIEARTIELGSITPARYTNEVLKNKYAKWVNNSDALFGALLKILMPYRARIMQGCQVSFEEVAFGYFGKSKFGGGNKSASTFDLVYLCATVIGKLKSIFDIEVLPTNPKTHKKKFTGNGAASKELSIAQMLQWFPQVAGNAIKLDDMADAMSIATCYIHDVRTYELTVNCPYK